MRHLWGNKEMIQLCKCVCVSLCVHAQMCVSVYVVCGYLSLCVNVCVVYVCEFVRTNVYV